MEMEVVEQKASILSLPPETLEIILDYVLLQDLINLKQVCNRMYTTVDRYLKNGLLFRVDSILPPTFAFPTSFPIPYAKVEESTLSNYNVTTLQEFQQISSSSIIMAEMTLYSLCLKITTGRDEENVSVTTYEAIGGEFYARTVRNPEFRGRQVKSSQLANIRAEQWRALLNGIFPTRSVDEELSFNSAEVLASLRMPAPNLHEIRVTESPNNAACIIPLLKGISTKFPVFHFTFDSQIEQMYFRGRTSLLDENRYLSLTQAQSGNVLDKNIFQLGIEAFTNVTELAFNGMKLESFIHDHILKVKYQSERLKKMTIIGGVYNLAYNFKSLQEFPALEELHITDSECCKGGDMFGPQILVSISFLKQLKKISTPWVGYFNKTGEKALIDISRNLSTHVDAQLIMKNGVCCIPPNILEDIMDRTPQVKIKFGICEPASCRKCH